MTKPPDFYNELTQTSKQRTNYCNSNILQLESCDDMLPETYY
jgi:hypothetical protein